MVIFLYGADSYRSKEKLNEIVAHYKKSKKSGLNLMHLDASQADFSNFYDNLKVSSMFAETKLVILKNVFSNKNFQESFLKNLKNLEHSKDVIVLYEGGEVLQRLKLLKILLKECKNQKFELLNTKGLKAWAQRKIEQYNGKIHPVKSVQSGVVPKAQQFNVINNDALDLLLAYAGNDLWRLSNEILKLCNLKNSLVIRKEDVELMVKSNIENDIFKTIDALAEKNKKQALYFLHKHLTGDDNPLYILSMISYQFKNLLMVKELSEKGMMYASIVKKSGLHPFVVKKTYFQCRQFTFEELKNIYHKIFKIDSDIKTGKTESETALYLLVSQI